MRGDFATDGKWAFVLVTVRKCKGVDEGPVNWVLLRQRLENLCPSKMYISTLSSHSREQLDQLDQGAWELKPGSLYILQVEVEDRVGLLHDVTQVCSTIVRGYTHCGV